MMFLIGNCLGGAFFVWLEQHNKAVSFLENVFDNESLLELKNIELNKTNSFSELWYKSIAKNSYYFTYDLGH